MIELKILLTTYIVSAFIYFAFIYRGDHKYWRFVVKVFLIAINYTFTFAYATFAIWQYM